MPAKASNQTTASLPTRVFDQVLSFLKHGRLAALLFLFALILGLCFYVYSKPVYQGVSLINCNIIRLSVQPDAGPQDAPWHRLRRALVAELSSDYLIKRTAMRLGLVGETATYDDVEENFIREVKVDSFEGQKLTLVVKPYNREVAGIWGRAMVAEYKAYKAEERMRYNEEAIASFNDDIAGIRQRMLESLEERLRFEDESKFAEQSLKAAEYNQMLVDLFMTRQHLRSAERTESAISQPGLDSFEVAGILATFAREVASREEPVIASTEPTKGPIAVGRAKDTLLLKPDTANPSEVEALREKRDLVIAERENAAQIFGAGHSRMVGLNRELALLEDQIKRTTDAAIQSFKAQYQYLRDTEKALEDRLPEGREAAASLSKQELEFGLLTNQLPWEKAYAEAQTRLQSIDFAGEKERVILHHDRLLKHNRTPISPNKMKLLYASFALGLALAFGVPIGLEQLNNTASKLDQLERELNIKGLGIIPVAPTEELEQIVRDSNAEARVPNSLLENFRVIRAGITLGERPDDRCQVLMITSARPSEGKTINSCNLGWAFSSVNEPTLLIDSDLRRGRIHNVLDLPNERGLSNVLLGTCLLEDAIQPTEVPNLWALTRGPIIAGSTERLLWEEHDDSLRRLRQRYSRIIMDTPPVLGLSETASLMRLADRVVLIIRAQRTSRRDLADAVTALSKSGANISGFVLNRLDLSRLHNYYNYYYYSANYYSELISDDLLEDSRSRDLKI